ncbi:MAG TPA: glycosyltransferase family 2 protein [Acidobacteriaceae bacterium]|nr:glycosyltransferase family 2 protein [Acidobacteriaceae bacterium]
MNEPATEQICNKPLLTIAIPTYNRSRYLRELLSVLHEQVVKQPDVELIISDNASPDDTSAVVAEFQQRGLSVRYMRNAENIGADANFLQCFAEARGKYFWLFGDDDVLLPGALRLLTERLASHTYDLVYVNSFPMESSTALNAVQGPLTVKESASASEFASKVHIYMTFITGNIIRKEAALRGLESPASELRNSNLLQLGWTYAALNEYHQGLVVEDKLIGARVDNTGGYKLLEVFGPALHTVTYSRVKDPRIRAIIMNAAIQRFWPGMLMSYRLKAHNFSREAAPEIVLGSVFGNNWRYWFFTAPIIRLPSALAKVWFLAVRIINRLDRASGYLLLRLRMPKSKA